MTFRKGVCAPGAVAEENNQTPPAAALAACLLLFLYLGRPQRTCEKVESRMFMRICNINVVADKLVPFLLVIFFFLSRLS